MNGPSQDADRPSSASSASANVSASVESAAEAKKELGNTHYRNKEYDQAAALYTAAIELAPGEPSYYCNRSAVYLMQKKYAEALDDAQKAIVLDKTFVKGYFRAAMCHLHQGDIAKARQVLTTASKLRNPAIAAELRKLDDLQAKVDRVRELMDNSSWGPALSLITVLLDEMDGWLDLALMRVQCLLALKRPSEAQAAIAPLFRQHPSNLDVLYHRGLCFHALGNGNAALEHFKQVLTMDPDHAKALRMFKLLKKLDALKTQGNTLFQEGKYADAVSVFTDALALDPSNATYNAAIYCNRAAAQIRLRQYQEALSDCKQAIELKQDYAKAYMRRAECYCKLEQWDDALRDYEKVAQLDPDMDSVQQKIRETKLAQKKAKRKDYYKILDVPRNADEQEIKKAYKRQALKYHPDKNRDTPETAAAAEKTFKDISEAYTVLMDPKLKRRYDSGVDLEDEPDFRGASDVNLSDMLRMFGGGGFFGGPFGGRGGRGSFHFE